MAKGHRVIARTRNEPNKANCPTKAKPETAVTVATTANDTGRSVDLKADYTGRDTLNEEKGVATFVKKAVGYAIESAGIVHHFVGGLPVLH